MDGMRVGSPATPQHFSQSASSNAGPEAPGPEERVVYHSFCNLVRQGFSQNP